MTAIILIALFYIAIITIWIRFCNNTRQAREDIDNTFKNASMTHNWTKEEGIKPNTDIYKFNNSMYAMHDKTLNRLYVYKYDGFPAQSPIDTTSITVQEFEETLIGIEKLK